MLAAKIVTAARLLEHSAEQLREATGWPLATAEDVIQAAAKVYMPSILRVADMAVLQSKFLTFGDHVIDATLGGGIPLQGVACTSLLAMYMIFNQRSRRSVGNRQQERRRRCIIFVCQHNFPSHVAACNHVLTCMAFNL